jgi:hypothetical protein
MSRLRSIAKRKVKEKERREEKEGKTPEGRVFSKIPTPPP